MRMTKVTFFMLIEIVIDRFRRFCYRWNLDSAGIDEQMSQSSDEQMSDEQVYHNQV